jgi:phosphatidylglycerophosphate synthase
MSLRVTLQHLIYKIIDPVVRLLIRIGLTPNGVTTIGLMLNVGVAVIFIAGGEEGNRGDLSYVGWAGALILFAGLFDMLDGQVARLGNMASAFGAMYDSVLDRYSELIMFLGICYYLVAHHYFLSSLFAFVSLIGSMMVSYTRARAEGLGVGIMGGMMQRPERVILVGITALLCGITAHIIGGNYKLFVTGIPFHIFETISIFTIPFFFMAILTNITAIRRLRDARRALEEKERVALKKSGSVQTLVLLAMMFSGCIGAQAQKLPALAARSEIMDSFPVPSGDPYQLFYLQRTSNKNTIVCDVNLVNGAPDKTSPVHVFWIRYAENGQRAELTYIQRTFAYGIQSTALPNGDGYEMHFAGSKSHSFYLVKSPASDKYNVYTTVNTRKIILRSIFIKINGGSFWVPKVEYVEIKGIDVASGRETTDRLKI